MLEAGVRYINEVFEAPRVSPHQLDRLLADGWRHFGTYFFRYSLGLHESDIRLVMPLRVRLSDSSLSKNQRRVLNANLDAVVQIEPIDITDEAAALFERHKRRFSFGVPDSIYDFLSDDPANVPGKALQVSVQIDSRLAAVSYFDVGEKSVSAIYAMFDPELARRSLGIFTMLKEMEYARQNEMEFYYQGYAYEGESFYDYKKRFRGTECFDWKGNWKPIGDIGERTGDSGERLTEDDADREGSKRT